MSFIFDVPALYFIFLVVKRLSANSSGVLMILDVMRTCYCKDIVSIVQRGDSNVATAL